MAIPIAYGQGPQALVALLKQHWSASRSGRADLPPLAEDDAPDGNAQNGRGVLVVHDRDDANVNKAVHDLVHCYNPQANPVDIQDGGFDEENVLESVQIDIECTDRNDAETGERIFARERMVGDYDFEAESTGFTLGGDGGATFGGDSGGTLGSSFDPYAYPGLLGEVKYILEGKRLGYEWWDTVDVTVMDMMLKNSSAVVKLDVTLEIISRPARTA